MPASGLQAPVQVAFMPDVHFHDVYAQFDGDGFPGIALPGSGRHATIRTMDAQLSSTRLFNENHFAFLAALDDAVARGVRLIVLPGDFSDDGQPVHVRGLVRILDDYAARHGVRFFVVPGNHDPVRPLDEPGGKPDYLGRDPVSGHIGPHAVYSRGGHAGCDGTARARRDRPDTPHCTEDVRHMGYAGITAALAGHGFMPRPQDRYYATPYSRYGVADYTLATARAQADWTTRSARICADVSNASAAGLCRDVIDTTYVVEPVDGLWLVGLDANVYVPNGPGANDFTGSGNQGWDAVLRHRPHVVDWLAGVVAEGAARGKQVVAFSHFPMAEFYNGASDGIAGLLGPGSMQMTRRPSDATTRALAATGLRVHVGGHMHFNDIAVRGRVGEDVLFNIQAPSVAAYVPAYTLMTLDGSPTIDVRTVRLDAVPGFDTFFDLYRAEHAGSAAPRWDADILEATDYRDFVRRYLTQLVQRRLLDADWPCALRGLARSPLSGADLLALSQLRTPVTLGALADGPARALFADDVYACLADPGLRAGDADAFDGDLAEARLRAESLAQAHGLALDDFAQWQAFDLAVDFVRIAQAGDLAFADIPQARAAHYAVLASALGPGTAAAPTDDARLDPDTPVGDFVRSRFGPLMTLMARVTAGAPTQHVELDLARDQLIDRAPAGPEAPTRILPVPFADPAQR